MTNSVFMQTIHRNSSRGWCDGVISSLFGGMNRKKKKTDGAYNDLKIIRPNSYVEIYRV